MNNTNKPFKKILIANRGEIACRVIKTCNDIGIKTVSIYSDADKDALHVKLADESKPLGGLTPTESYLNIEKIIEIALETKSEAIHPGYGFLSENTDFAKACVDNNIIFIIEHYLFYANCVYAKETRFIIYHTFYFFCASFNIWDRIHLGLNSPTDKFT